MLCKTRFLLEENNILQRKAILFMTSNINYAYNLIYL